MSRLNGPDKKLKIQVKKNKKQIQQDLFLTSFKTYVQNCTLSQLLIFIKIKRLDKFT